MPGIQNVVFTEESPLNSSHSCCLMIAVMIEWRYNQRNKEAFIMKLTIIRIVILSLVLALCAASALAEPLDGG